jgi:hypothetical protein
MINKRPCCDRDGYVDQVPVVMEPTLLQGHAHVEEQYVRLCPVNTFDNTSIIFRTSAMVEVAMRTADATHAGCGCETLSRMINDTRLSAKPVHRTPLRSQRCTYRR